MIIEVFAPLFIFMMILVFYSFIRDDLDNYTDIIFGFVAGMLSILLGLEVFDGIEIYGSTDVLIMFKIGWVGLFLCTFGVIMIIYSVVLVISTISEGIDKIPSSW